MKNTVWYLTAPDGRVVGASARGAWWALHDVPSGTVLRTTYWHLVDAMEDPTATRYEAAGYVLARGEVVVHA